MDVAAKVGRGRTGTLSSRWLICFFFACDDVTRRDMTRTLAAMTVNICVDPPAKSALAFSAEGSAVARTVSCFATATVWSLVSAVASVCCGV